jgi:hypothetical protein
MSNEAEKVQEFILNLDFSEPGIIVGIILGIMAAMALGGVLLEILGATLWFIGMIFYGLFSTIWFIMKSIPSLWRGSVRASRAGVKAARVTNEALTKKQPLFQKWADALTKAPRRKS